MMPLSLKHCQSVHKEVNTIYLHLGLHKTGTKSIQSSILPQIEHAEYIGRFVDANAYGTELYEKITSYCFSNRNSDKKLLEIRENINNILENRSLLLSEEWFTSNYDPLSSIRLNWQEKLKRLGAIVQGYKVSVLITRREPVDALYSFYCELLRLGYMKKYDDFYHFLLEDNSALAYKYDYLGKIIEEEFSISPVYVDFEDLQNDQYVQKLENFFNCKVNRITEEKNKKLYTENGAIVTAIDDTGSIKYKAYALIRTIWLLLPYRVRKLLPGNSIQRLRNLFFSKFSSNRFVAAPDDREIEYINHHFK